jgi:kynurenine formamidase
MGYKLYDLSWPNVHMGPQWPHLGMFQERILKRVHTHTTGLPGGITRQVSIWESTLHSATHMDAPAHEKRGGWFAAQIPLDRCYGTGVVVDFRYMKKWDKITAEDFENAKPAIQEGDFVVVNTGWHRYWRVKEYVYHNYYPGLVPSGAEWLVKKKVKAVAGTWGALDHPLAYAGMRDDYFWRYEEYRKETGKEAEEDFPTYEPCHNILCTNDIFAIENAGGDIDQVTGKRCTIAAFPCRLEETIGHPVRVVAIVEE